MPPLRCVALESGTGPRGAAHGDMVATLAIAGAMAIAGAFSPARPVGVRPADAVWAAALAGVVALAGSRARPGPLLWLAAITAAVGVRGDAAAIVLGVGALIGAVLLVAAGRRSAPAGAAIAGLAALALLWGPSYGFSGLPSIVAVIAITPVLWVAIRSLGPPGRRRVLIVTLVVGGLLVMGSAMAGLAALSVQHRLSDAAQQARDGLALVRDGKVEDASPALDSSADEFHRSSNTLDGFLAFPGRLIPVVGHQVEALRRVSDAGEDLAGTAADASPARQLPVVAQ